MLDINPLIDIDRHLLSVFNGSNSLFLDGLMVTLTSGITWIPLYLSLLYLIIKNSDTAAQIMLIVGCCLLCLILSDGMADFLIKPLVGRLRPCNDPLINGTVNIVNQMRNNSFSFFSAHASNTFSIALFFCLMVRGKLFGTALILWSLINCYTRLYLGLHYPGDIIAGLLWGTVVAIVVHFIYSKIYNKVQTRANFISTQYTCTGYDYQSTYVVIIVLALTLCYATIRASVF